MDVQRGQGLCANGQNRERLKRKGTSSFILQGSEAEPVCSARRPRDLEDEKEKGGEGTLQAMTALERKRWLDHRGGGGSFEGGNSSSRGRSHCEET